jgi:hypothetical protein
MRTSSNYALRWPGFSQKSDRGGCSRRWYDTEPVYRQCGRGKTRGAQDSGLFAKRAARADFPAFDRLMKGRGGEAAQPSDEVPENYHKKKSPRRSSAHF